MSTNPAESSHTLSELLSQPQAWQNTLRKFESNELFDAILEQAKSRKEWLFVACGSSLYLATAAASSWTLMTGLRARAIPASEILLFPDAESLEAKDLQAVLVSRSGTTSETVRAAEVLSQKYKVPTLGVTCTSPSP